ncbi:MAG: DNA primase [Xanthomonadales bacterium]|nr:DNA primase [Xanthomonadales bacterium]
MAARIPQSFLDELLARTDLVELIQSRVPLKRAGREFKALCPFHDERTPSFTVSPRKQFYHCFGCGAHGDAIGFLMAYEHLGFLDAVEELAARAGLEVPREARGGDEREPLYEILAAASRFYRAQLEASAEARAYLGRRGIDPATADRFQLGYAPEGWDRLVRALGRGEGERAALLAAGLALRGREGLYDRFRHRLMFPILDGRGRPVGFGGRVLGAGEPKYLNSPETALFQKGRLLYALWQARREGGGRRLIAVEGYLDAITLHQHGFARGRRHPRHGGDAGAGGDAVPHRARRGVLLRRRPRRPSGGLARGGGRARPDARRPAGAVPVPARGRGSGQLRAARGRRPLRGPARGGAAAFRLRARASRRGGRARHGRGPRALPRARARRCSRASRRAPSASSSPRRSPAAAERRARRAPSAPSPRAARGSGTGAQHPPHPAAHADRPAAAASGPRRGGGTRSVGRSSPVTPAAASACCSSCSSSASASRGSAPRPCSRASPAAASTRRCSGSRPSPWPEGEEAERREFEGALRQLLREALQHRLAELRLRCERPEGGEAAREAYREALRELAALRRQSALTRRRGAERGEGGAAQRGGDPARAADGADEQQPVALAAELVRGIGADGVAGEGAAGELAGDAQLLAQPPQPPPQAVALLLRALSRVLRGPQRAPRAGARAHACSSARPVAAQGSAASARVTRRRRVRSRASPGSRSSRRASTRSRRTRSAGASAAASSAGIRPAAASASRASSTACASRSRESERSSRRSRPSRRRPRSPRVSAASASAARQRLSALRPKWMPW